MRRLIAFLFALLVACDPATVPSAPSPAHPAGDPVEVDFVIDGDTFDSVDGRRFRLDGINAPDNGECMYDTARAQLATLIEGSTVDVTLTGNDQFGRALADVHADDLWVNLELVSLGLALATTSGDEAGDDLVVAEAKAFSEGVGLWADEACGASSPRPAVSLDAGSSVVDPPGPDEEDLGAERIIVANAGETEVELTGWMIRDESSRHRFTFPPGTILLPGQSLTVTSADRGWDPGGSPVWNNSGDLVLLLDEVGRVVDRFRY